MLWLKRCVCFFHYSHAHLCRIECFNKGPCSDLQLIGLLASVEVEPS